MANSAPRTIREYQLLVAKQEAALTAAAEKQILLETTIGNLMPVTDLQTLADEVVVDLESALSSYTVNYPNWEEYPFLAVPHKIQAAIELLDNL